MWKILLPRAHHHHRHSSGSGRRHTITSTSNANTTSSNNHSRRSRHHHNHSHSHHSHRHHGHNHRHGGGTANDEHGHGHGHGSHSHNHCTNNNNNGTTSSSTNKCQACQAPIGIATVNGQRVRVGYCQRHNCNKIESGGTLCTARNNGRTAYCDNHARCQATAGQDGRCWGIVKETNPEKFRLCKDHGCTHPTCPLPRTRDGIPCCPQHRCLGPSTCERPRQVGGGGESTTAAGPPSSFFCDQHTCSSPSCNALAANIISPSGNNDDNKTQTPPFCDLHRPCAREGCSRRCHVREATGLVASFCGAHYCSVGDCPDQRKEASAEAFCERHSCVEPGCFQGRKKVDEGRARFCADHECHFEGGSGCFERVDLRVKGCEYCAVHRCVVEGCAEPAMDGRGEMRCVNHRYCVVEGCKEWIFIEQVGEGEIRHPECENHHAPQCQALNLLTNTPCGRRLPPNTPHSPTPIHFCDLHTCAFRSCHNARPLDSLQYCALHKCRFSGGCQDLVTVPNAASNATTTLLSQLAAALGGGGGATLGLDDFLLGRGVCDLTWLTGSGRLGMNFCARHTCQANGGGGGSQCGEEVVPVGTGTTIDTHSSDEDDDNSEYDDVDDDDDGRGRRGHRTRRRQDANLTTAANHNNGELGRFCKTHKCSHRGCPSEATSRNGSGTCDHHSIKVKPRHKKKKKKTRSGSHHRRRQDNGPPSPSLFGGPGGGPFLPPFGMMPSQSGAMPMPMPMPMMIPGYPPFFGPPGFCPPPPNQMYDDGGGSDSEGSSSEDDGGGGDRRAPQVPPRFPGMFL